jgi:hypothetical protein
VQTVNTLILIHVISGLAGILSGLVFVAGMLRQKQIRRLDAFFLAATFGAGFTGFCFLPIDGFSSAQLVGVFSTVLLGLAVHARYLRHSAGTWKRVLRNCSDNGTFSERADRHHAIISALSVSQGTRPVSNQPGVHRG